MKKNWTVLLCLGLAGLPALAQLAPAAPATAASAGQPRQTARTSPREQAVLAQASMADNNALASNRFLEAHRAKPGVITLSSGVQYRILVAGAGAQPVEESAVRLRYQGTLVDGRSFDKVDAATGPGMRVAGLLPGLKQAVKLMPSGAKWELVVPAQMAYGAAGHRAVGPNAALVYVVELLGVN